MAEGRAGQEIAACPSARCLAIRQAGGGRESNGEPIRAKVESESTSPPVFHKFQFWFFGRIFLLRLRMKRRASRLKSGFVRLTIRQTLARGTFDGKATSRRCGSS